MTAQHEPVCNDALRAQLMARLTAFEMLEHPVEDRHRAAVALTIVDEYLGADLDGLPRHAQPSPRAALVLTRRAETLRRHAGQWALPGGRIDPGETPEQTALRELAEEVDLLLPAAAVIGRLDDFTTRSGFVMTPIVVWGGTVESMTPNPGEVASIHRIPLTEFLREDAPHLEAGAADAEPVLRMPVGAGAIAAPTAALLYQFREVALLGRTTRVAHFEQPRFAWR